MQPSLNLLLGFRAKKTPARTPQPGSGYLSSQYIIMLNVCCQPQSY